MISKKDSSSADKPKRSKRLKKHDWSGDVSSRGSLVEKENGRPPPMRRYSNVKSSMNYRQAGRSGRKIAHWGWPILTFLVIVVSGVALASHFWFSGDSDREVAFVGVAPALQEGADSSAPSVAVRSEFLTPADLSGLYLEALGGVEVVQSVRSMRKSGFFQQGADTFEFSTIKKMPGMAALTLESDGIETSRLVTNSELAWEVGGSAGLVRELSEGETMEVLALAGEMLDPVARAALGLDGRILSVIATELAGRPSWLAIILNEDGSRIRCYLDRESLRLNVIERTSASGHLCEIRYDDYRPLDSFFLPYRVALCRDGEVQSEFLVSSVLMNTGAVSSLFEVPEELVQ